MTTVTLQESGRCVSDKCEEEKEEKGGVILKTQPKEMKLMSQQEYIDTIFSP